MATRSTRQKAGHVTTSIVVPSGAPSWVTAELLQKTLEVWQPYYEQELIPEDALAIIMGAGQMFDCLSPRPSKGHSHEEIRRPGTRQQP